jgi:glycosyltransferase involved in cell wall biosynthesis
MYQHVFFTDALGAGGISTNIVALASHVAITGPRPYIVPLSMRRYSNSIWDYSTGISKVTSMLGFLLIILQSKSTPYVFFVNGARTLLFGCLALCLSVFRKHKIKLVFCVYHPSEFSCAGYWSRFYRRLVCSLGKKNIYFMNGACFAKHNCLVQPGFLIPNLLPLVFPALPCASGHQLISPDKKSVLTVGRFVGFKMHYLRALMQYALVRPSFNFYFVGDGEGYAELAAYVVSQKLANVFLLGSVDYADLQSLYTKATCYLGMGTTLVEASSFGKPSIVAIAGVPGDVCYGLFVDQGEYDMGEYRATKPMLSISESLDYVLGLDCQKLSALGRRHKEFSQSFSIESVGSRYIHLCNLSSFTPLSLRLVIICVGFVIVSFFYLFAYGALGGKSRYDVACV